MFNERVIEKKETVKVSYGSITGPAILVKKTTGRFLVMDGGCHPIIIPENRWKKSNIEILEGGG